MEQDQILERNGLITTNQTWSGTVRITGSISIRNGATVTILPGTRVLIDDSKSIRIIVGSDGFLKANNGGSERIFIGTESQLGSWSGIEFQGNANTYADGSEGMHGSVLAGVDITNARQAVSISEQGLSISDTSFANNSSNIILKNAKGVLVASSIFDGSGAGIDTLYEGGGTHKDVWITGNTFRNDSNGISIWPNQRDVDNIVIEENIFSTGGVSLGGG